MTFFIPEINSVKTVQEENKIIRDLRLKRLIPSFFTLGNLLCGFLAVLNVVEGTKENLVHAAWWIIIAAIFDLLDGKIARLTRTASDFGIELDSLADVVSFGVAPAVLFYKYAFSDAGSIGYFVSFLFLAAGSLRLARFNVTASKGKKLYFKGMPIPAGASILAAFILFSENVWGGFLNFDFCVVLIIMSSLAMVSSFKYGLFPKLSFFNKLETIKSLWIISLLIVSAIFPDESFFPLGVYYLFSGPIKFFSAPAFNFVFHKE